MSSWTFSEAVLGVDLCPPWSQVCAAGGDWSGWGPGVSHLCNSLSLSPCRGKQSVLGCLLPGNRELSPEVPQCLCDLLCVSPQLPLPSPCQRVGAA